MTKRKIGIIGGGVTGITAAYELLKMGHSVSIFEKSQMGGLISSLKIGESHLEKFYHHMFLVDRALMDIVHEIGLDDAMLWRETPMGFFINNEKLPFGTPKDLLGFTPLSPIDRIKFGVSILYFQRRKKWRDLDIIGVEEWFRNHYLTNVFETIWKPLLKSKFGDSYRDISAAWMWGRIHPRSNSRQSGREKLGYFKGGYHVLVERLMEVIRNLGCEIHEKSDIEKIVIENGRASAIIADGQRFDFDNIVVTTAPHIFQLICPDLPQRYKDFLNAFRYNGVICLILKMNRSLGRYYWLNINDPEILFGGVIEHTNFIPPSEYGGFHLAYVFKYLPKEHPYFSLTEEELLAEYWKGLKKIFPDLERDWIEEIILTKTGYATPIYFLDYAKKKPPYRTPIPNLYMVNMTQIYPEDRNVSACIQIVKEFLKELPH